MVLLVCASDKLFFWGDGCQRIGFMLSWWRSLFVKILAAHRQGYRVRTLHVEKWLGNPIPLSMCSWEVLYAYLGAYSGVNLDTFKSLPGGGKNSYLPVVHLCGKCQQIRPGPWILEEISTNQLRKTFCFGSCHFKMLYPYTPNGKQFRPKLEINWDQLPRQVGDKLQFSVIILMKLKSWSWIQLWKLLSPGGRVSWVK